MWGCLFRGYPWVVSNAETNQKICNPQPGLRHGLEDVVIQQLRVALLRPKTPSCQARGPCRVAPPICMEPDGVGSWKTIILLKGPGPCQVPANWWDTCFPPTRQESNSCGNLGFPRFCAVCNLFGIFLIRFSDPQSLVWKFRQQISI